MVHEISSENHSVNGIFTVSTRWISHNFFRIWCKSPPLSELISVSSGRIDFKIVLNQSYGCILPGKNCFGTVPSPQKSPTTSLQRENWSEPNRFVCSPGRPGRPRPPELHHLPRPRRERPQRRPGPEHCYKVCEVQLLRSLRNPLVQGDGDLQ